MHTKLFINVSCIFIIPSLCFAPNFSGGPITPQKNRYYVLAIESDELIFSFMEIQVFQYSLNVFFLINFQVQTDIHMYT